MVVTILGDTYIEGNRDIEQNAYQYEPRSAWFYGGCVISFTFPPIGDETDTR